MSDRQVTRTRKDRDGDILALCDDSASWSPRGKSEAITDIETGMHTYYVTWAGSRRTEILVVNGPTGKYLRTDADSTARNNLADLRDC